MTPVKTQSGFTIVEVILFLALAGLVFVIGFIGIGGRSRSVQFNDSVRTVDSFLQSQLNAVQTGVNRSVTADNVPDEVLLGKYVAFCSPTNTHSRCNGANGSRILVYDVVGDVLNDGLLSGIKAGTDDCSISHNTTDPDIRMLDCAQPRIVGDPQVAKIEWGTQFLSANHGVQNYAVGGFGFLRSPNSARILFVTHWDAAWLAGAPPTDNNFINEIETASNMFHSNSNSFDPAGSVSYCFRSAADSRYAYLIIGYSERQTSIETVFDPQWTPDNPQGGQLPNSCGDL